MSFLDNLLREATEGVLGHARGKRIGREDRRLRQIEEAELQRQVNQDATRSFFDNARREEIVRKGEERTAATDKAERDRAAAEAAMVEAGFDDTLRASLWAGGMSEVQRALREARKPEPEPSPTDVRRQMSATAQDMIRADPDSPDFDIQAVRAMGALQEQNPEVSGEIIRQIVDDVAQKLRGQGRSAESAERARNRVGGGDLLTDVDAELAAQVGAGGGVDGEINTIDEDRPAGFDSLITDDLPQPGERRATEELPPQPEGLSPAAQIAVEAAGSPEAAIQALTSDPEFANDEQAKEIVVELTRIIGG